MTSPNIYQQTANLFAMSDRTWERHSNPWSVWTRNTVLPLLILAIWSRSWIGWWAIAPTVVAVLWTWLNPRLFSKPESTDNWASRAVFGERVWLNRDRVPIPEYHHFVPHLLTVVSSIGMLFVIFGVATFSIWATLLGCALVYCGKLWFCDRMAWLYRDMQEATPEYRSWLY